MSLNDENIKSCSKHGIYVDLGSGLCPQCEEEKSNTENLDDTQVIGVIDDFDDEDE
jgi:hypothetical protein